MDGRSVLNVLLRVRDPNNAVAVVRVQNQLVSGES